MLYRKLGGTDGFRGAATLETGPGLMNRETVAGLTYALASIQQEIHGRGGLFVIGRDTRRSGVCLIEAAIAGAVSAGAEVVSLEVAPTPTVLKIAQNRHAIGAVVITASHNPEKDNGWKGTIGADKPYGDEVAEIDIRYWDQVDNNLVIPKFIDNYVSRGDEATQEYIQDLVWSIQAEYGENPLEDSIYVVDGAYGAAKAVTPQVLRMLGADVVEFATGNQGVINDGCGATDLTGVKKFLQERPELVQDPRFKGVLANDGDGDRVIGLGVDFDEAGNMIFHELNGNCVIELLSIRYPGVVGTEYCNNASIDRVRAQSKDFILCPNGDVEVTRALRKHGLTRGGEFTGHFVDLDWLSSGDGVRMAAWIAAFVTKNNTTVAELSKNMPMWPEVMHKLKIQNGLGEVIMADETVLDACQLSAEETAEKLRIVVRPSGTEPVMRIWGVGRNEAMVNRRAQLIVDAMSKYAL